MSKWKYNGSPEKVYTICLDRRRFKTNKGIIDCPDGLDEEMARCKQFTKLDKKKPTKVIKQVIDKDKKDGD